MSVSQYNLKCYVFIQTLEKIEILDSMLHHTTLYFPSLYTFVVIVVQFEIPFGLAQSVQVMGSFDGWSRGVSMSPEYDGFSTKFSTTLRLKPGRYYTYPLFNSHICMILWILFLMSIYHFRVTIRYREWVLVREGFAFFIIHLTIPRILDPRLVSGPSSE